MSVRNLDRLFEPERIAVVGASGERGSVGNIVLRNLVASGFGGVVYPLNRSREAVEGVAAYALLEELPSTPDVAVVCTPAATVPDVVRACGDCRIPAVAVLSAGFREAGREGEALERSIAREAARFSGLRVLGPNCLGYMVPRLGVNATFASGLPAPGPVALVSQSGALASSLVDWAIKHGVGFSYVVSLGNMLDVDVGDVLDYLGQDPATRGMVLYVESVTQARKFMSAARAFTRAKPIVAYKAGRFAASAEAARSHTGVMTGSDAVYDAAFKRAGIVRERRIDDTFASAELLALAPLPRGARLAIVTNAGGPGVMAADALLALGGELAALSGPTLRALDAELPPFWSHGNPIDVLGDASAERYAVALRAALADDGVDAVLVILSPQAITQPLAVAETVAEARGESRKPVLAVWMGGDEVEDGLERLSGAGVAAWSFPEHAVGAFMSLVRYARLREALYETPRAIPVALSVDRQRVARKLVAAHGADGDVLSETASKELLDAYGIPVTEPELASSADEAVAVAERIGYPVVLKVDAPGLVHKSDVGGVETDLSSAAEVRRAYARIAGELAGDPERRVRGVTVQRMETSFGYELILGARRDPTFGAVIMVGAGGLASEVLDDSAAELPPLNERLARRMLEGASHLAAASRTGAHARGRARCAARAAHAHLVSRRRPSRDRRDRRQPPARRAARRSGARRQRDPGRGAAEAKAAALLPARDPPLSRGVHDRDDAVRRPARDPAGDRARGRAALARDARRLL
jgi:acetyltransferase